MVIGQVATHKEIKARWAYAEVRSTRFPVYPHLTASLQKRLDGGANFDDLTEADWDELIEGLVKARNQKIVDNVGTRSYRVVEWSIVELMGCLVLPSYDAAKQGMMTQYSIFDSSPRWVDAQGNPDVSDARVAAEAIGRPLGPHGGAIAIDVGGGKLLLLEGYTRSQLFVHFSPLGTKLLVWVPI